MSNFEGKQFRDIFGVDFFNRETIDLIISISFLLHEFYQLVTLWKDVGKMFNNFR